MINFVLCYKIKIMRKLLFTLMFGIFGIVSMIAQEITVEKDIIDYGTIEQGASGVRSFVVKNTGNKPLLIKDVVSSCGCTIPEKPKKPILPGKTDEIKVEYDTNRIGKFSKSITVFSNDEKSARKILRIRGEIVPKK